jgi:uncharacterized protein yqaK
MENGLTTLPKLKTMLSNEQVMNNLKAMLGSKAQGFATSVLSTVNNNKLLQNADAGSIYTAAMLAASLDLPINQNLGFAALVPYAGQCQFQIMTKGLVQLAIRSGQYAKITNAVVHEGELVKYNPFTDEYVFDVTKRTSDKVIGYMAYFKTIGGFEKYFYMTTAEMEEHGKKYSKSFGRKNRSGEWSSLWQTDPQSMGLKTVIKLLLSKFGILSIEMQRAINFDQAAVKGEVNTVEDIETLEPEYVDNEPQPLEATEEEVNPAKDLFDEKNGKPSEKKKEEKK